MRLRSYRGVFEAMVHDLRMLMREFVLLPRRWVVERSFGWLGRYRRLSKDYERYTKSSEGVIYIASAHIMLRRTVSHGQFSNALSGTASCLRFSRPALRRISNA